MEMKIHKSSELISFVFRDMNNKFIVTSNLSGENFRYIKGEQSIVIKIDIEKNIRNCYSDDMKEFRNWYKDLKVIYVDNKHIIKGIKSLDKYRVTSKYFLELNIGQRQIKKYALSVVNHENIGIKLNLDYIKLFGNTY